MRRLMICALLIFAVCATTASAQTRVLFVGNSQTQANYMPDLFAGLAEAAGHAVDVDMAVVGGYTLEQHTADADTRAKLGGGEPWDIVFLQEYTLYSLVDYARVNFFYPAARTLNSRIVNSGAQTGFFMVWGRPYGGVRCLDPEHCTPDFPDHFAMQDALRDSYSAISEELGAMLAPVGVAWSTALEQDPELVLWDVDDIHPSLEGSYLAACVFFATVFAESPVGLGFHGGVDPARALFYQQIAADQAVPTEKTSLGSLKSLFR